MSNNEHIASLLDEIASLQVAVFHRVFAAADAEAEAKRLEEILQKATLELLDGARCHVDDDCPPGYYCDLETEVCRIVPANTLKARFTEGKYR
ncbi:MAG: hypothetical protein PVJ49_20675 [Acidobacteriota bacterium]|jgi:hypothetical protein